MPRVSIGLPVYNGEQFLKEAIDSILAQTFEDFELIISDNASTDKTREICKKYAANDRRIKYFRTDKNLGAARNYNRVFELSRGEYFKWAAHDDMCAPEYLERCVEVLDNNPSVVVCHTKTTYINEDGKIYEKFKNYDDRLDFTSPKPHVRFRDCYFYQAVRRNAIFGVIRANELKKTPLIGSYVLSDQVLLGELALLGKIYRISEYLFFRRSYSNVIRQRNTSIKARLIWFDEANRNKKMILPKNLPLFYECLRSIRRVQLSWQEQIWCYLYMIRWGFKHIWWMSFQRLSSKAYRLLVSFEKQKKLVGLFVRKKESNKNLYKP